MAVFMRDDDVKSKGSCGSEYDRAIAKLIVLCLAILALRIYGIA